MEVLSDDATDELAAAASSVTALLDGVYFPFGDDGKQSPIRLFRGSVRLRAFAALGRARDARGDKGGEAGLRDVGAGTAAAASGEFVEVCDGVAARSAQTVLIQLPAANLFGRVGVYNFQQSVDVFDVPVLFSGCVGVGLDHHGQLHSRHPDDELQH